MKYWLLKTEPSDYSWADLVRDKKTVWDGIGNNAALLHLRAAAKGDRCVIYQTGKDKSAMGLATITKTAYVDPKRDEEKYKVVDIKVDTAITQPVTLAQCKAEPVFADSPFVKQGRLSFVPLTAAQFKKICSLGKTKA